MESILLNRIKTLNKQKNIILSELKNPDNLNPEFISSRSRMLNEIENRLTEVQTILLEYKNNKLNEFNSNLY